MPLHGSVRHDVGKGITVNQPETRSVAIISAVNPRPADSGKKIVLSGFLDYWLDRLGPENVHYVLVRPASESMTDTARETFPTTLHRVASPTTSAQLHALTTRTLTGRASIQEAMLHSNRLGAELGALLTEVDADLEIYDTVRLGQYARKLPRRAGRRRVIYLDDLFSHRYRAMLRAAKEHGDVLISPLGAFASMIPQALRRPVENRLVQRLLLMAESRLVARAERAATEEFDRCLLVNDGEARMLRAETSSSNVYAVPPLVPTPAGVAREYDGRPEFVFLGLCSRPCASAPASRSS
jgi:hypothetical protein